MRALNPVAVVIMMHDRRAPPHTLLRHAQMKHELEEGTAREAEAQAAILAANARRALQQAFDRCASRRTHILADVHAPFGASFDSSKEKDYFVAMVSHEARTPNSNSSRHPSAPSLTRRRHIRRSARR
jgi:hypothetical protein